MAPNKILVFCKCLNLHKTQKLYYNHLKDKTNMYRWKIIQLQQSITKAKFNLSFKYLKSDNITKKDLIENFVFIMLFKVLMYINLF